jgi:hypothetical protein
VVLNTPPPINDPSAKDAEHLRLLAIFHFIFAAFAIIGLAAIFTHFAIMQAIFSNPEVLKQSKSGPMPAEVMKILLLVYVFIGLLMVLAAALNVFSGFFLRQRRYRMFSLIVAGLNCLQVPFGTALGVFTIIVLTRDSVRLAYESAAGLPPR